MYKLLKQFHQPADSLCLLNVLALGQKTGSPCGHSPFKELLYRSPGDSLRGAVLVALFAVTRGLLEIFVERVRCAGPRILRFASANLADRGQRYAGSLGDLIQRMEWDAPKVLDNKVNSCGMGGHETHYYPYTGF